MVKYLLEMISKHSPAIGVTAWWNSGELRFLPTFFSEDWLSLHRVYLVKKEKAMRQKDVNEDLKILMDDLSDAFCPYADVWILPSSHVETKIDEDKIRAYVLEMKQFEN